MSLPITNVGGINSLAFPSTVTIYNVAWTIAPNGLYLGGLGTSRIYDAAISGGNVAVDLTALLASHPHVAFYFGSSTTQFALHTHPPSGVVARPSVRNAALGITFSGSSSHVVGVPRAYDSALNGGNVAIDLTELLTYTSQNLFFYFGDQPQQWVRASVGARGASVSRPTVYRNYQSVFVPAMQPNTPPRPRAYDAVYTGGDVLLNLTELGTSSMLYFGGDKQLVQPRSVLATTFARPVVANAAQAAYPSGAFSEVFGRAVSADASLNGRRVDLLFVAAYAVPTAANVPFYLAVSNQVYHRTWMSSRVGEQHVGLYIRHVYPLAWTYHLFGSTSLYTLTQYIFPYFSTPTSRFGYPAWANATREVFAWGGQPSSVVNDGAEIELRARIVTGVTLGLQTNFGTQYVADFYQVIRFVGAFQSEAFGTAKADWLVRTLYVQPSADPPSVMPPMVGRHVAISIEGFQSSTFGTFIAYNGIPMWPSGWRSSAAADTLETRVRLQRRFLPTQTLGTISSIDLATIYNLNQYVLHINGYDELDWAKYGLADVQNAIKELRPQGWRSDRFAYYPADLVQPYQVIPAAITPQTFPRPIQVAFRIRYFPMEGIDSYVPGRWIVVWKNSKEVYPTGIAPSAIVARPESVENRNRRFKMHWVLDSMEFGTAMVADRVRRVQHWFPYQGSQFPLTYDVRVNPHPIAPAGWDQDRDRHAAPYVEEHFTIIHPWGKLPAWPPLSNGTKVENRNRSYTPGTFVPLEQDRYGRPRVENWIRYLYPQGKTPDNWFGITDIRDNKQYPSMVPGLRSSVVPVTHKVEYTSITPYITRKLFATGLASSTAWGSTVFPRVQLFPSGIAPIAPPQPVVKAMSIFPRTVRDSVELDKRFGLPFIVSPQWITDVRVKNPPGEVTEYGKPQMSPWTVWARFDAPQQAKDNYLEKDWELVDEWKLPTYQHVLGQFGDQWVALKNRTVYAWAGALKPANAYPAGSLEVFGFPLVQLKRRWVYAQGRSFLRVGMIDIPTSPRTLAHWDAQLSEGFGTTKVQHPEEVGYSGVARASSWKSHEFGTNAIELFNRTIGPPAAFTSNLRYGAYVDGLDGIQLTSETNGGQPPVVPPPSRVGFPIKRQMTGIAPVQEPQVALVAYKIRHVFPEGTDMLQVRSSMLSGFNSKMRVWKAL